MLTYTGIACPFVALDCCIPRHFGQHATFIIVIVLTTGKVVDQFWHEIADYLNEIETLYEELLLTSLAPFFCHTATSEVKLLDRSPFCC